MNMKSKHHIIIFEGPFERPGDLVIKKFARIKKARKLIKEKNPDKTEYHLLNGLVVNGVPGKVKLHFIEIGRKPGSQAYEVHYDVIPDEMGRGVKRREISGVQLTEDQVLSLIDKMEPILKKNRISVRWLKPGETLDG